jgi:diacylglycerol kinase (ATP)
VPVPRGHPTMPAAPPRGPTETATRTGDPMPSSEARGPRQIWRALQWSIKGLGAAWRHEASFRLEACLCAGLLPLGFWLGHGAIEKALLCGSLLLVLSMELLNSAVEAVVDKVSPEFHELAGRAKDMGSAAVLLLMFNVALCWGLILWPRL